MAKEHKTVVFKVAKQGNSGPGGMRIESYQNEMDRLGSDGWKIESVYPSIISPDSWSEFVNTIVFVREAQK